MIADAAAYREAVDLALALDPGARASLLFELAVAQTDDGIPAAHVLEPIENGIRRGRNLKDSHSTPYSAA